MPILLFKLGLKLQMGPLFAVSELQGDITIGSRTVIHPRAKIIALLGPIIIGENNIIEEQVQIINK